VAAFDLCDLQDVRAFLQKPTGDVGQDEIVQTLISSASRTILRYCNREFAPAGTAGILRTFEISADGLLRFAPWDLQAATLVQIDTDLTAQTLTLTTDYKLLPAGKPDGVYTSLRLTRLIPGTYTYCRQLQITGTWGFPAVPDDVRQAAAITTALWLRRDVSAFTTTFNEIEGHVERPEALPSSVRAMLRTYIRPLVA
jgi:hypothetical protein